MKRHAALLIPLFVAMGLLFMFLAVAFDPARGEETGPNPTVLGSPLVVQLVKHDGAHSCTASYVTRPGMSTGGDPAWVLTAGHCAWGGLTLRDRDGVLEDVRWQIAFMGENPDYTKRELALGHVWYPSLPEGQQALVLSRTDPRPGETVWIHGFPRGREVVLRATVVTPESITGPGRPVVKGSLYLRVEGLVAGGASGSPVLNSRGELVGMLWGIYVGDDPRAGFMPVEKANAVITPVSQVLAAWDLING